LGASSAGPSLPYDGAGYGHTPSPPYPHQPGGAVGEQPEAPTGFDFAALTQPAAPGGGFDFASLAAAAAQPAGTSPMQVSANAPLAGVAMPPGMPAFPGGPASDVQTQQVPAFEPPGDPFASVANPQTDARAMFDMPPSTGPVEAPPASPLADLPPPEPPAPPSPAEPPHVAVAAGAPPPAPGEEAPVKRRRVLGLVVNIGIAAVLVLGVVVVGSAMLNEGKVSDALSWEGIKSTFAPSASFVARDVTNGLYETKAGRAVFFVRGEVVNRTDRPVTIVVKAELVDGGKVVRGAESWAGAPPSPEELYLIDSAEALEALNARVEKRAQAVEPGAAVPFVVTFTEYPPDLKDFRVRVSARAKEAPAAALGP
jgi:hypothetical protein